MIELPPDARILRILLKREPNETLVLDELALLAGLDSSTLLKRLSELEAAGYLFERHPVLGTRLAGVPERLIGDEILARMKHPEWLHEILVFKETRSTNDLVNQLGASGSRNGTVVFAESQTAGRGRFGRIWDSKPYSGLWFSLLIRPELPVNAWPKYTLASALAVCDGIEALANVQPGIKWPNDVQIGGKKACGILLENRGFLTIGIGINVNQTDFPKELEKQATSLFLQGCQVNRTALAAAILDAAELRFSQLLQDPAALLIDYRSKCLVLGEFVQLISSGGAVHSGIATEVDPNGKLGIRSDSGEVNWFGEGEVTFDKNLFRTAH